MRRLVIFSIILIYIILMVSYTESWRYKRTVSNSVEDILGIKGTSKTNKRKKQPVKVTPPLRLKPGETPEQPPGWKHCIKNMRAALNWKVFKSPGYPDFLESQIQCSWILEAPIGWKVKIAFRDLDMIGTTGSCAKQFVQIIDISTGKSQGRFCGEQRPGDYVTLGTKARIDLQADKAVTKVRGFFISFSAVKEIPGFRSTKTFSSMPKSGEGAPGKVDIKNFVSKSSTNLPKPPPGSKRQSKRLQYESDRNPDSTDPSVTTTESSPSDNVGSDDDLGWIGNDADINTSGRSRAPSNAPLKVRTGNRQRPRPQPTNNGPIIITQSTLPVRIRAKNIIKPTPSLSSEETETESQGPVIYGEDNQPFDSGLQNTLSPIRGNRYIEHRPEVLTTTNLIIICACGGLFLLILCLLIMFFCFYRRRRRRKKKREAERKRKEEQQKRGNNELELNVVNLSEDGDPKFREIEINRMGRQRELPGAPPLERDEILRYPGRRSAFPQNGTMERSSHRYDERDREVPNHIPLRHEDQQRRHNELRHYRRSYEPDMQRRPGYNDNVRHHTIDPRRHQPRMTSQIRHQSLDPRQLERDHNMRLSEFRRNSGKHYNHEKFPTGAVPHEDDEDYVSGGSEGSLSGRTAMRREYSPWELEQQKKERRIKLINGEL